MYCQNVFKLYCEYRFKLVQLRLILYVQFGNGIFFLMIFREKKLRNEKKIMEIRYIVGTVMFMWMLTFEDLHGHSSTVDVKTKNWNPFQKN